MIKQLNKGLALLLVTVLALSLSGALITVFAAPAEDGGYEYNVNDENGDADQVFDNIAPLQWNCWPECICPQGPHIPCTVVIVCDYCGVAFEVVISGVPEESGAVILSIFVDGELIHYEIHRASDEGPWGPGGNVWYYFDLGEIDGPWYHVIRVFQHGNGLTAGNIYQRGCPPEPRATKYADLIKQWVGDTADDRPEYIEVLLYIDGYRCPEGTVFTLTAPYWRIELDPLYKYCDYDPELYPPIPILYAVREIVPAGYQANGALIPLVQCPVDGTWSVTIINTLIVPPHERTRGEIEIIKLWDDNNNARGIRPGTIQVQLLKGLSRETLAPYGDPMTVRATEGWRYTFEVYRYDEDLVSFVYSVTEVNVPAGYEYSVDYDSTADVITFTITNTLRPLPPDDPPPVRQQPTPAAPKTGDLATAIPLLASVLLSVSAVLGGTSLKNRFRK